MARFASYALTQTEWRDLKVACAALMLVQPHAGQPIKDDDGERRVPRRRLPRRRRGDDRSSTRRSRTKMLTPKAVLRVAELLETPVIAELNRIAGFSDAGSKKAPLGRWKRAATRWLAIREKNLPMLQGLVKAGYKETIKNIARKAGYKPESAAFFEVLGWKQKQAAGGHRDGRHVGPEAPEARALRRPLRGRDLRGDRRRRSSPTRTSSAGCRRTSGSRRPSWWRCCRRSRTATSASSRRRSRSSAS